MFHSRVTLIGTHRVEHAGLVAWGDAQFPGLDWGHELRTAPMRHRDWMGWRSRLAVPDRDPNIEHSQETCTSRGRVRKVTDTLLEGLADIPLLGLAGFTSSRAVETS